MFALECNFKISLNNKNNMLCVKVLYRIFESEKIVPGFPFSVHRSNYCYVFIITFLCINKSMHGHVHTHTHTHTHTLTHLGDRLGIFFDTPSYNFLFFT